MTSIRKTTCVAPTPWWTWRAQRRYLTTRRADYRAWSSRISRKEREKPSGPTRSNPPELAHGLRKRKAGAVSTAIRKRRETGGYNVCDRVYIDFERYRLH